MTKYCSSCHRALPRSAFHRNQARWDGRATWCKACLRERYGRRRGYRGMARLAATGWPPAPRG